jgi:hypothetical protein
LPESGRACQRLPESGRACQGLPESGRACQGLPESGRACQGLPESGRACQGSPKYGRARQRLPGSGRTCRGLPRIVSDYQVISELPNLQKLRKYSKSASKKSSKDAQASTTLSSSPHHCTIPTKQSLLPPLHHNDSHFTLLNARFSFASFFGGNELFT